MKIITRPSSRNSKKSQTPSLMILISALAFFSCAKDQTAEQYQESVLSHDFAEYKAVSGTYTGTAVQANSGRTIGVVSLDLEADLETSPNSTDSGGGSLQQPVMKAHLNFSGSNAASIDSDTCTFVPDNGSLTAESTVAMTSSASATAGGFSGASVLVKWIGGISNGHFSGVIYSNGYEEQKILLELDVNGPSVASIKSKYGSGFPDLNQLQSIYEAKIQLPGQPAPTAPNVTMTINRTDIQDTQQFVGMIYPVHPASVQFDMGEDATFILSGVRMDLNDGTLEYSPADVKSPSNSAIDLGTLGLTCTNQGTAWNCQLSSARSGATLIGGTFLPVSQTPVLPGVYLAGITNRFNGTALQSDGTTKAVHLNVSQPTETGILAIQGWFAAQAFQAVNADIEVDVPNALPGTNVRLAFSNSEWDMVNKKLLAQGSSPTIAAPLTLSCDNFSLSPLTPQPSYNFTCTYSSPTGAMTFSFVGP